MRNLVSILCIFLLFTVSHSFAQTLGSSSHHIIESEGFSKSLNSDFFLTPIVFGEPRTPLKSSFYNVDMLYHDWRKQENSQFIKPTKYTLFGLESKINRNKKVVIYDASITKISNNTFATNNLIHVNSDNVIIKSSDRTYLIPLQYSGDNSIEANSISKEEKLLISDYVKKSLTYSGTTPSAINIIIKNGDFDISILKSQFTNEDIILEGYNLRSRVTRKVLLANIASNLEYADLKKAKENLDIASFKFPKSEEFLNLLEQYDKLSELNFINNNSKVCIVRFIEENQTGFVVYDGISQKKNNEIKDKSYFIQDLINSLKGEKKVVYLEVEGMGNSKADAFINSTNIQIKTHRPDVYVKPLPKDIISQKVLFDSEVLQKNLETPPIISDYSQVHSYDVKSGGGIWKIGLGMTVNTSIVQSKAKKAINSFFKYFDKTVKKSNEWNLADAVNFVKSETFKKDKGIKYEDCQTFINHELFGTNFVFIQKIKQ